MNSITAEKRDGSVKAKQLRRGGLVPCVIYGGSLERSLSVQIDKGTARQLQSLGREGSKVEVRLGDRTIPTMIRNIERSFTGGEVTHISFQALEPDKKINGKAGVVIKNKEMIAGLLEQTLFEIRYSALPADLFDTVVIDLEDLPVGTVITVGDLPEFQNEKIELSAAADLMVLRISEKRGGSSEPVSE